MNSGPIRRDLGRPQPKSHRPSRCLEPRRQRTRRRRTPSADSRGCKGGRRPFRSRPAAPNVAPVCAKSARSRRNARRSDVPRRPRGAEPGAKIRPSTSPPACVHASINRQQQATRGGCRATGQARHCIPAGALQRQPWGSHGKPGGGGVASGGVGTAAWGERGETGRQGGPGVPRTRRQGYPEPTIPAAPAPAHPRGEAPPGRAR